MITITQGQAVAENDGLVVFSSGNNYADTDLILCALAEQPSVPIAMYQAQFVRYGSIVYQFNTPEDLGKALVETDPDSTHDAVVLYQQQAARDAARAAGTLTPDTGADITATPSDTPPPTTTDTASSTPPVIVDAPPPVDVSTSTAPVAQDDAALDVSPAPIDSGLFNDDSASTSVSTTTPEQ